MRPKDLIYLRMLGKMEKKKERKGSSLEEAIALMEVIEEIKKKATDTEKDKHKDKIKKPEGSFLKNEKMDVIHVFLFMLAAMPIVGTLMLQLYLSWAVHFVETLKPIVH